MDADEILRRMETTPEWIYTTDGRAAYIQFLIQNIPPHTDPGAVAVAYLAAMFNSVAAVALQEGEMIEHDEAIHLAMQYIHDSVVLLDALIVRDMREARNN